MTKELTYERYDALGLEIAKHYVLKDPDLSHINLGELRFVRVLEKKSDKMVEVKGVVEPVSLFTDFKYVIITYAESFDQLSEVKQNLYILHALTSISEEFDGKMRAKEIKEYSKFVEKYGPYWYLEEDEFLENKSGMKFKKISADISNEEKELNEFLVD